MPIIAPYSYLIVDDDVFTSKVLARLLQKLGAHDVEIANNGKIAVDWLEITDKKPDIIICDIHMPELDGVECMLHLANKQFTGGIIIISGSTIKMLEPVTRLARAHNLNVLGALSKPITMEKIEYLISQFSKCENNQNTMDKTRSGNL